MALFVLLSANGDLLRQHTVIRFSTPVMHFSSEVLNTATIHVTQYVPCCLDSERAAEGC